MRKRGAPLSQKQSLKSYGSTSSYGSNSSSESKSYNQKSEIYNSTQNSVEIETNNGSYNHYQSSSLSDNHIGTVKNNYYDQVRRQQQEENSFWKVLQDMLAYIYESIGANQNPNDVTITQQNTNSNTSNYPEIEHYIDEESLAKLEKFKTYITLNYDSKDEEHEALLAELWKLSSNEELESRICNQWKTIGFQGKDPATDFRGVGVFGLYNLLFFAKNYPKKYSSMLVKTKKNTHMSYPFAIAGFNITMMLFDILGFGFQANKSKNNEAKKNFIELITKNMKKFDQSTWFNILETEEIETTPKESKEDFLLDFEEFKKPTIKEKKSSKKNVKTEEKKKRKKKKSSIFEEIYVASFIVLDEEWYALNATYFSFPKVMENTRKRVEDLLENRFESYEDVVNYIKKK
eukprot:gene1468-12087_t